MLGVVCGLKSEAACLPVSDRILIGISGARPDRAEDEAHRLVAEGATALISFGLAGGLDDRLSPGTLLRPRLILDEDGRKHAVDAGLANALKETGPAGPAPFLGVDRLIDGPDEKRALWQRHRAAALDMESHRVARVAEAASVPFAVLRAVADPAIRPLPKTAHEAVAEDGSIRMVATLTSLLRRPGDLPQLLALQKDAAAALKTLRQAALWLPTVRVAAA